MDQIKSRFKFSLANLLSYLATGAVIFSALLFTYVTVVPLDILQDWKLTVDKSQYKIGDDILVRSEFKKIRSVTGIAKRYIECKNTSGKFSNRVQANEASADRPVGSGGSDLYLTIPDNIPNLPATCRISVVVEYEIYAFRKHTESTKSGEFIVYPSDKQSNVISPNQQDDNVVVENSPATGSTNARRDNFPSQQTQPQAPSSNDLMPNPGVVEESEVIPPNDALVCKLGPVTGIYNLIVGGC